MQKILQWDCDVSTPLIDVKEVESTSVDKTQDYARIFLRKTQKKSPKSITCISYPVWICLES